ncbi:MAG: SDR family NAD(P)-dependent oxidoreductase [Wenzhouxiangellaceae bacterium]|nr:SDR family NAD(P)-dependent oxidoreductase [Wenzhouxiangellaceae bacterium]
MPDVERQLALVTGAAGTLGRALVSALIARGFDCVALDRNRRGLEQLHDQLAAQGTPPLGVPLDLAGAGPQHYAELAESLGEQFGRLDLLIHAAAEFRALTPIEHTDPEDWMKVLQAGLTGPFLLSRALLPLMRATPGSVMLWVADDEKVRRAAYWGGYGVAQAGRAALAGILAAECARDAPDVRLVDPGPFHSPLRSRAWPAERPDALPSVEQAVARVLAAVEGDG